MSKKHKCPECAAGEKWAVPYADFLSLLLALFIALWAISESNPAKVEALKTEFVKIFDFTSSHTLDTPSQNTQKHQGASTTPQDEIESLKSLTMTQQETIKKLKAALDQQENQVALQLPARVEFERGSADIVSQDVKDFIKYMIEFSSQLSPKVKIEIRGYTDNSDTAKRSFELGYKRAEAVANYFLDGGINSQNISIKSFGLNEPLDNDPSLSKNNRVEVYYKVDVADDETQKSVIERMNSFNQ